MNNIPKKNWKNIIRGANLLGTGGGGTISGAENILKNIKKPVSILTFEELQPDDLICTVFGVGGKQNCDPIAASRKSLALFQETLKKDIQAIISVEAGPMAVANAMFIASELEIPLIDSDIVGMRSSPEVYLEAISLKNLNRIPCAISDGKGNSAVLFESESLEHLEQFLRSFAIAAGGDAVIAGYPLRVHEVIDILPHGTISTAQQLGTGLEMLSNNQMTLQDFCKHFGWKLLGEGLLTTKQKDTSKGFAEGVYEITQGKECYEVVFKNENIIVKKNTTVILTCPDSISLLDLTSYDAINNFLPANKISVGIVGRSAIPIWKTKEGKKLFHPQGLGYKNVTQKLL